MHKINISGLLLTGSWSVLVLLMIGWESGASFLNQTHGVEKQNQNKRKLLSNSKVLITVNFSHLHYNVFERTGNFWEKL